MPYNVNVEPERNVVPKAVNKTEFMAAVERHKPTEALTKLDGTAKGGVVIGIADQFKIPVKYIGVGEKIHQLQVFNKSEFVDSLFN